MPAAEERRMAKVMVRFAGASSSSSSSSSLSCSCSGLSWG